MRLSEIKALREDELLGRILTELKIQGLGDVYIQTTDDVDFLELGVSVMQFLDSNKHKVGSLSADQYERLIVICLDELFEKIPILEGVEEEQIARLISLLRNTQVVHTFVERAFRRLLTCGCKSRINNCFL